MSSFVIAVFPPACGFPPTIVLLSLARSEGKEERLATHGNESFTGRLNTDSVPSANSAPSLKLLTKGDNNPADDTELYARGQDYLEREEDIIGSVVGYIPFVGYVTIMLSEHPWLKTAALGLMGIMVVLQPE